MRSIFIAHPKGHVSRHAEDTALTIAKEPNTVAILARDHWTATFAFAGSWDDWTRSVGAGLDWQGRPSFDGYVVTTEFVGRGTAAIVHHALSSGRPVVFFPKGGTPAAVTHLSAVPGSDSWTHGWQVHTQ